MAEMQARAVEPDVPVTERRRFLKLASLGAGVALFATFRPGALFAKEAEALLLSCMDFRLMAHVARYMASRKMVGAYDHVIVAGASLGVLTDRYPAWGKTFWEHVEIAIALHKIPKVMVMDHRDCGAYETLLGEEHAKDAAAERAIHAQHLTELRQAINARYPKLEVELLLMALDGKVETIS